MSEALFSVMCFTICGQKLSIDSNIKTVESIETKELNEKSGKNEVFSQTLRRSD
jgi:hypothetical protein